MQTATTKIAGVAILMNKINIKNFKVNKDKDYFIMINGSPSGRYNKNI